MWKLTFFGESLRYFSSQYFVKLQKHFVKRQSIFLVRLNRMTIFGKDWKIALIMTFREFCHTLCENSDLRDFTSTPPPLEKKHYYWNRENHKYAVIVVYFSCSKCSGTNCTILKVPKKCPFFHFLLSISKKWYTYFIKHGR